MRNKKDEHSASALALDNAPNGGARKAFDSGLELRILRVGA
jgi:hypothetical protein